MHPFGEAVLAGDMDAAVALLADDVVFRSPVVFKPYEGREVVAVILHAVAQVFEDFRYVRAVGEGDDHVLEFAARVGDKRISGADFIHVDGDGKIDDFTVMVRPLSAAHALADAMKAKLAAAT